MNMLLNATNGNTESSLESLANSLGVNLHRAAFYSKDSYFDNLLDEVRSALRRNAAELEAGTRGNEFENAGIPLPQPIVSDVGHSQCGSDIY